MVKMHQSSRLLLALLCLLAVFLRVTGVHLHLCMDGSEPAVSYHFEDVPGQHHQDEQAPHPAASQHDDLDISLLTDALLKLGTYSMDLLQMFSALAALVWLLCSTPAQPISPASWQMPFRSSVNVLLPPLRGPPSLHR